MEEEMAEQQTEQQPEAVAADYPEAWRPEAGDKIAGRLVSVVLGPDFGYGPYPILTLETKWQEKAKGQAGEERAVHAMHHVLRTELARRRPQPGDQLEITYQGTRAPKSGTGRPFHVYRVVGGREPEFNWDAELSDHERVDRAEAMSRDDIPIAPSPVPQKPQTPVDDTDDLPF